MSEPQLPDFRTATDAEYLGSLVTTLDSLQPVLGVSPESGGILSPPIQAQVATLSSSIEVFSGMPFGSIAGLVGDVQALATATNASQVVVGIGGLLDNTAQTVATVASALGVTSSAVEVIPIVGAVVGFVLNVIGEILSVGKTDAQKRAECVDAANEWCTDWVKATGPQGIQSTSIVSGGPSPADHFRLLAYNYQKGTKNYPASVPTLILALCGDKAGDFGLSEVDYWDAFTDSQGNLKKVAGKQVVGLDPDTRERLWKAIQSVMVCSVDPYNVYGTYVGDQGRSAMPIIMDILVNGYHQKRFTRETLIELAQKALRYKHKKCGTRRVGCGVMVRESLADALEKNIVDFAWGLKNSPLWDNQAGVWKDPSSAVISAAPSSSPAATSHDSRMRKVSGQRLKLPISWMKNSAVQFDASRRGDNSGSMAFVIGAAAVGAYLLLKGRR